MNVDDLLPDSTLAKADKYRLAWRLLGPSYTDDERAHAQCWLTYRCFDGEISFADWQNHIEIVKINPCPRWVCSNALSFGICKHKGGDLDGAVPLFELAASFLLNQECTLNALRASAILSRYFLTRNNLAAAFKIISSSLERWQKMIGGVNLFENPKWIADGGGDLAPVHFLLESASQIGMCKPFSSGWIASWEHAQNSLPWKLCLDELRSPEDIGKAWIVVCKHSDEFNTAQASKIKNQFEKCARGTGWKFVCLTDRPTEEWHLPLTSKKSGWWSIMESFRFKGPHILTGLDSVIMGDILPLISIAEKCPEDTLYGIRDFYQPSEWASGITIWRGNWRKLNDICCKSQMTKFRGNQEFTRHAVKNGMIFNRKLAFLQDEVNGIISYKRDVRDAGLKEPPKHTMVCCFHGNPRPWDIQLEWLA